MAFYTPIKTPQLVRQNGNLNIQKAGVSNSTNTFLAGSFVQLSSGVLQAVPTSSATASTKLVHGWVGEASTSATDIPPVAFFGAKHYPFDVTNVEFEINITDGSTNVGASGPTQSAVTVGSSYGMVRPTSGDYTGVQMLNSAETTNVVFVVTSLGDGASTDTNPRVRVKILPAAIQA